MSSDVFTYSQLPEDCFRLLQVSKVSREGHLQCELSTVSIQGAPEYDALSYAWNNEVPSLRILCNGKSLVTTPSLHEALRVLPEAQHPRLLWADAICINQKNEQEKAAQVPLMGVFYSNARSVVVWLGAAGMKTDAAMDSIESLSEILARVNGMVLLSDAAFNQCQLPNTADPLWRGLDDIFARQWFQRLWTVQEVALASNCVVYCGSKHVSWPSLSSLSEGLSRTGIRNHIREGRTIDPGRSDGFSAMMLPDSIRDLRKQGRRYRLGALLQSARSREATEPVDKVYAVLGLAEASVRQEIKVNYSGSARKEFWRAYVNASHVSLSESGDLSLLTMTSSKWRPLQLPSWCPNFASPQLALPLPPQTKESLGIGSVTTPSPHIASSVDGLRITLLGLAIDDVATVIPLEWEWKVTQVDQVGPSGSAAACFDYLNACRELSNKTLGVHPKAVPEALLRALIADTWHDPFTTHPDLRELQQAALAATIYLQVTRDGLFYTDAGLTEDEVQLLLRYLNAVNLVCSHRRFFVTASGCLGVGPVDIRPSDKVCTFRQCSMPLVLRPEGEHQAHNEPRSSVSGDERNFRLVGEAYLHGIRKASLVRREHIESEDQHATDRRPAQVQETLFTLI